MHLYWTRSCSMQHTCTAAAVRASITFSRQLQVVWAPEVPPRPLLMSQGAPLLKPLGPKISNFATFVFSVPKFSSNEELLSRQLCTVPRNTKVHLHSPCTLNICDNFTVLHRFSKFNTPTDFCLSQDSSGSFYLGLLFISQKIATCPMYMVLSIKIVVCIIKNVVCKKNTNCPRPLPGARWTLMDFRPMLSLLEEFHPFELWTSTR